MMNNIKVDVYPLDNKDSKTRAFCNVSFDERFVVKGIRVVVGSKGLFVAMPQSQDKDGKYHDVFFPITKEAREELHEAVLEAYDKKVNPPKKYYNK
jgi:stage V sporulation protein G